MSKPSRMSVAMVKLMIAALSGVLMVSPVPAQSSCGPAEILRDNALYNVIYARNCLTAYEEIYKSYADFGTIDSSRSRLNKLRGETIYYAISAYYDIGGVDWPEDDSELMKVLCSLNVEQRTNFGFPASLDALVECGILPSLPESPYETGLYLDELPANPVAGDVYYHPFCVSESSSLLGEPGALESCVFMVFDKEDEWSSNMRTFSAMDDNFPGDLSKFIPVDIDTPVCYIRGGDPDTDY